MKRLFLLAAAPAAAVALLVALTLPPRRLSLASSPDGTIAGSVHIHTSRSDGRDTPDEIAAAAARARLTFIIFTDHGDATRTPEAPSYRSGVLCLDGVEISTTGGHYLALDLPASPYPLAGEPRDVADDVRRLGGFGIAAHPDSPKPELRWRDWNAPIDAVEWINPDTSWRVWAQAPGWTGRFRLLEALLHYPIRPAETMASLLTGADETLAHWNAVSSRRRVVGIAGVDAHANLALRGDPVDSRRSLPLPGYEASFRTLSVHVRPERPLTGDPAVDGALVVRAIRAGHLYLAVDAVASPPSLEFSATDGRRTVREGDELAATGPVTLRVRSNAPPRFQTILWRGPDVVTSREGGDVEATLGAEPAVYRAEVRSAEATRRATWLFSNAIYIRGVDPHAAGVPPLPPASTSTPLFDGRTTAGWHPESDTTSSSSLEVAGAAPPALRFRYALSGPHAGSPSATAVRAVLGGAAAYDRVTFTARAGRPMRVSVQLRTADGNERPRRWQRSVYLGTADEERTVRFDDLVPAAGVRPAAPPLDRVDSVMFVVDTTNTRPGTAGQIWITRAALER